MYIKRPFQALSPCPIQILAGALIYITYLSDTKMSSTEVTFIFAIVSNFSDFPLHSMQKCIKTVVLLDRPPFVPSAGDIVFLLFFSKVM